MKKNRFDWFWTICRGIYKCLHVDCATVWLDLHLCAPAGTAAPCSPIQSSWSTAATMGTMLSVTPSSLILVRKTTQLTASQWKIWQNCIFDRKPKRSSRPPSVSVPPFPVSDANSWTEVTLPQLSVPRAGHSIITMETAGHLRFSEEDQDTDADRAAIGRTLLVFGGGDNEGVFYSDLTTVAVEELLAAL